MLPTALLAIFVPILLGRSSTSAPPALTRLEAGDFSFRAPRELPAGLHRMRLVNRGPSVHHLIITIVAPNATFSSITYDLKSLDPKTVAAKYVDIGGPDMAAAGDSSEAFVLLKPGRYLFSCWLEAGDGKTHFDKGMMSLVDVKGPMPNVEELRHSLTIEAKEYAFAFSAPPTAGSHVVRLENRGTQEHDIQFIRLDKGQTREDVMRWTRSGHNRPPGTLVGGTTGIMPGRTVLFPLMLQRGQRYVVLCHVPDDKDGRMHAAHGMLQEFAVK